MLNYRPGLAPENYAKFLLPMLYSQKWLDAQFVDDNGVEWRVKNQDVVLKELIESKSKFTEQFFGVVYQMIAVFLHYVSPARLKQIRDSRIPVLVITGTDDKLVNPTNSYYLKEALQAEQFIVLEGAGHMIHRECHKEVNTALNQHFMLHQNRLQKSSL